MTIICITETNAKRQLKWKNQITEMTKQLQIQIPIEMYTGNEVASFLIDLGLLTYLTDDEWKGIGKLNINIFRI